MMIGGDHVSQQITPYVVTPSVHLYDKCWIDLGWSSALRLNQYSLLKTPRLQSVTRQLAPGSAKIQSTLPMICLEGDKWRRADSREVVRKDVVTFMMARSSRALVFLGHPDPPRR
ncbi:hypothetical protein TNCV_3848741 [Trichonephila clavipes]|uniref:Uncharacterized protein n=1 Tax=Trichonephila clavipes TaxID=2585209 RepID=A0A8X6V217_TRICX|nr:hypothetical protein TNCV_3848741 [Trichonephila clavipes]